MIKFYDDFLPKEEYEKLYNLMTSNSVPWFYTPNITITEVVKSGLNIDNKAADKNLFYLIHLFYADDRPLSSTYDEFIRPFLYKLKAKTFIRVKANLYPGQNKLTQHDSHTDYGFEHKAAIYCLNTCDGYTAFKQGEKWEKIDSVANRLITFDGSIEHASTDCTNATARMNINFNYL